MSGMSWVPLRGGRYVNLAHVWCVADGEIRYRPDSTEVPHLRLCVVGGGEDLVLGGADRAAVLAALARLCGSDTAGAAQHVSERPGLQAYFGLHRRRDDGRQDGD